MGLDCTCPVGTALSDITINSCFEDMGQIQKFVVQRTYSSGVTLNFFDLNASTPVVPTALGDWQTFLNATNGTKAVQTPFVQAPEFTAGEMNGYGGDDNSTLGGKTRNMGRLYSGFKGEFHSQNQKAIKELKALECEEVSLYFIDEGGNIWGIVDNMTTPTEFRGVPVENFFVGDRQPGGFGVPDKNAVSFQLPPNWSDYLKKYTPVGFNAKKDLVKTT